MNTEGMRPSTNIEDRTSELDTQVREADEALGKLLKKLPKDENGDFLPYISPTAKLTQASAHTKEPYLTWPERILANFFYAVKNFDDLSQAAATGQTDPLEEDNLKRSAAMGLEMVLGPATILAGAAKGTLGSFIGLRARNFNTNNMLKAEEMEAAGKSVDEIFKATQTFRGAVDGLWRQEIVDPANLIRSGVNIKPHAHTYKLAEVIQHPELFKAYPELKEVRVIFTDTLPPGVGGRFLKETNTIHLNHKVPPREMDQIVAHEVQHKIQDLEGFDQGANFIEMQSRLSKRFAELGRKLTASGTDTEKNEYLKLMDFFINKGEELTKWLYFRKGGEIEARKTMDRLGMTAEERAFQPGYENTMSREGWTFNYPEAVNVHPDVAELFKTGISP